ncbi:DUF4230 domain-containing protein [Chitinophagaceae bacterium MMS25-I14]
MKNILRFISALIILTATIIVGYTIGKKAGQKESRSVMIENYAFIREIAELASLEANGITTFKSTNVADDGSWTAGLQKMFLEKTVQLQVPYTAKYGVVLSDSSIRVEKKKDMLEIHLPPPSLLSYELRLDRLEANSRKGWLQFSDEDMYTAFQKTMYTRNRAQMEHNQQYLTLAQNRISSILQHYFSPLHIQVSCVFDGQQRVQSLKN